MRKGVASQEKKRRCTPDAAAISRVAAFLNHLPAAPPTGYGCSSARPGFLLTFAGSHAPQLQVIPVCGDYSITIGGTEEGFLAGQGTAFTTLLTSLSTMPTAQ